MPKRVLIFGADGMLGSEFVQWMKNDPRYLVFSCGRKCADITRLASVAAIIKKRRPAVVINCSAKINVDRCEAEPLRAWLVNAIGPGNIVRALADLNLGNTLFVQISTSDVFGERSKRFSQEDDLPHPVSVYGWSKLGGEKITQAEAEAGRIKYFVIRTSWLYSTKRNTFIDLVASSLIHGKKVDVVVDQFNVPTWTRDLVSGVMLLIAGRRRFKNGIYHLVSAPEKLVSRYVMAIFIAKTLGCNRRLIKKSFRKDVFRVPRPRNATLLKSRGVSMPDWQKSLRRYLVEKYLIKN